ncbi:MAG: hypothetical protein ACFFAJ_12545 [Candidatus Hodarchaeota archaeon]
MKSNKIEHAGTFWIPLFLAVLIFCIAEVLLKWGNIEINSTTSALFKGELWFRFLTNISIVIAFVLSLISKLIMGYILSKNPLGFSEGLFLGLSALTLFTLGIVFFYELLNIQKASAICIIAIGIFLLYSRENPTHKNLKKKGN